MANCMLEENGKTRIECTDDIPLKCCLKNEEGIKWQAFLTYSTNISMLFTYLHLEIMCTLHAIKEQRSYNALTVRQTMNTLNYMSNAMYKKYTKNSDHEITSLGKIKDNQENLTVEMNKNFNLSKEVSKNFNNLIDRYEEGQQKVIASTINFTGSLKDIEHDFAQSFEVITNKIDFLSSIHSWIVAQFITWNSFAFYLICLIILFGLSLVTKVPRNKWAYLGFVIIHFIFEWALSKLILWINSNSVNMTTSLLMTERMLFLTIGSFFMIKNTGSRKNLKRTILSKVRNIFGQHTKFEELLKNVLKHIQRLNKKMHASKENRIVKRNKQ